MYIALLRGINVGKAKRVPMADLRSVLGDLGHTDVATLLNSGNAVFRVDRGTPKALAAEISQALAARFQFEVPVVVKSAKELAAIAAANALAAIAAANALAAQAPDPSRLLVAFVQDARQLPGLAAIAPLVAPPEQFLVGKHAAYLYCAKGILQSKAGAALLGKAGKAATTRNWATVLKLQAMVSEDSA